jgi:hypothetical protein
MIKTITATVLFGASAFAQTQGEQVDKLKAEIQTRLTLVNESLSQTVFISSEGFNESTVAGAPFSADETNTTTQMLFDGNRIVHSSTTKVYRDQQGRTRVERTLSNIGPLAASQPSVNITVNDPVANVRYTLDAESKTAHKFSTQNGGGSSEAAGLARMKLAEELSKAKVRAETSSYAFTSATVMQKAERNAKHEELGMSNIAGVPVKGTRSTIVIPAGAEGNDRDINIVDERWYSPDLKMNILTKHSDPRMGETVFQVNNLTRSNPDPSLFQVPADYQVKEGSQRTIKLDTKE